MFNKIISAYKASFESRDWRETVREREELKSGKADEVMVQFVIENKV